MHMWNWIAVGSGAAIGAWLRWGLGILLNPLVPNVPLGTLAANLLAGLLIGVAIEGFARHPALSVEMRMFIITGFLGGLSTFSTFSAEVVNLLRNREYWWSAGVISLHVVGSVAMTIAGMLLLRHFLSLARP